MMPRQAALVGKKVQSARNNRPASLMEPLEERQLLSLVVDLILPGGGKTVAATRVGQVVQLEMWATITNSQGNSGVKLLQLAEGSLLSTNVGVGAALGTMAATTISPFKGFASQLGTAADLDGDGDLDIGSNDNNTATDFLIARADSGISDPAASSGAARFKLGDVTFTITQLLSGSQTQLNFRPRDSELAALWAEDGHDADPTHGAFAAGSPVILFRDLTGPSRKVKATNVTFGGAGAYNFSVTYTDPSLVKGTSIGSTDVQVTGPSGFNKLAKLVSKITSSDGKTIIVNYRVTPPGGQWKASANGVYTITMRDREVVDLLGNFVLGGKLGTFTVKIPKR